MLKLLSLAVIKGRKELKRKRLQKKKYPMRTWDGTVINAVTQRILRGRKLAVTAAENPVR